MYKFLWKNSRDRIKRVTLESPIQDGGCNVINVRVLNKCLKLVWLKRLIENKGSWSHVILDEMPDMCLIDFLNCNWKLCDIPVKILRYKFWAEVLLYWSELTYIYEPDDIDVVLDMFIWFNHEIKINKKTVYYKDWYNAGIRKIGDITKGNSILSHIEIEEKFGIKINYLTYWGLIQALPKKWKKIIYDFKVDLDNRMSCNVDYVGILCTYPKPNKVFYKIFMSNKSQPPEERINRWGEELDVIIEPGEYLDKLYIYI